jgi:predicted ABC-type ATPase
VKHRRKLNGRHYIRLIRQWRGIGYRVKLIFLSLPDADMAVERVRIRVAQGGHDVPKQVIRRRFGKGWNNFHDIYKRLVDAWVLYDNSGENPLLIDTGENKRMNTKKRRFTTPILSRLNRHYGGPQKGRAKQPGKPARRW